MPHFHCSSMMLEPGSVILLGNWGRIIRTCGWQHNLALKEASIEYVRQKQFPEKPSRLDALFFFDAENEGRFYASSEGRQLTMIAYEIEILDPSAPQHRTDWRSLTARGPVSLDWIVDYWNGVMLPAHADPMWSAACEEVFAVTSARIIRRL